MSNAVDNIVSFQPNRKEKMNVNFTDVDELTLLHDEATAVDIVDRNVKTAIRMFNATPASSLSEYKYLDLDKALDVVKRIIDAYDDNAPKSLASAIEAARDLLVCVG